MPATTRLQNSASHPIEFVLKSAIDHATPLCGIPASQITVQLFKGGSGQAVSPAGAISENSVPNVAAPTVTPTGTTGATTYFYQVVPRGLGNTTGYGSNLAPTAAIPGAAVTTTTTGNATLSGTNYNAISWTASAGAQSYDVLRASSGGAWNLVANTVGTTLNDTGATTTLYAVPLGNTTSRGTYSIAGNATDTNTLGDLVVAIDAPGADPVVATYQVVAYNIDNAASLGLTNLASSSSPSMPLSQGVFAT